MKTISHHNHRLLPMLRVAIAAIAMAGGVYAQTTSPWLANPEYRNTSYPAGIPAGAANPDSMASFNGHVENLAAVIANSTQYYLAQSAFGTPVSPGTRTVNLGEEITPAFDGINLTVTPTITPLDANQNAVFWIANASGSNGKLIGTGEGVVQITWATGKVETVAVLVRAAKTPALVYHTHSSDVLFNPLPVGTGPQPSLVPLIKYPTGVSVQPVYTTQMPELPSGDPNNRYIVCDNPWDGGNSRVIFAKQRTGLLVVVVRAVSGGAFLGTEILDIRPFAPASTVAQGNIGGVIQPATPPDHGSGDYVNSGGKYFASALLRATINGSVFETLEDETLASETGTGGPRALVRVPTGATAPFSEFLRIRPSEPWNDGNNGDLHVVWRFKGAGNIAWPWTMDRYHVELPSEGSVPVLAADPVVTGSHGGVGLEIPAAINIPRSAGPLVYKQQTDLPVFWDTTSRIISAAGDGWIILVINPDNTLDRDDDQCLVFRTRVRISGVVEDQDPDDGTPVVYPWAIGDEITPPDLTGWAYGWILEGTNYAKWLQVLTSADILVGGVPRAPDVYDASTQGRSHKQIFPVNEGTLKVLWKKELSVTNATGAVVGAIDYANRIRTYACYWPDDQALDGTSHYNATPDKIVVAGQKGTGRIDDIDPAAGVYFQSLPAEPGFNPNDEHAWRTNRASIDGEAAVGDAIYALRADLYAQATTPQDRALVSKPYVLMYYQNPPASGSFGFHVYKVLLEDGQDDFLVVTPRTPGHQLPLKREVALPFDAFHPLTEIRVIAPSGYDPAPGNVFEDRKGTLWARHADGNATARLFWKYQLQDSKGFYWPDFLASRVDTSSDPALRLVWFGADGGQSPLAVEYELSWPVVPPADEIQLAQTTDAIGDVRNQASIDILYDQAKQVGGKTRSLQAIRYGGDPANPSYPRTVDLLATNFPSGPVEDLGSRKEFPTLPPALRKTVYYDTLNQKLVCNGVKVTPVLGPAYFLLNIISGTDTTGDRGALLALADDTRFSWTNGSVGRNAFRSALLALANKCVAADDIGNLSGAAADVAATTFKALTAGNADGTGYVTLAFGNFGGTFPPGRVIDPPVALKVVKVANLLFQGVLHIQPDWDALENGQPPPALRVDNPFEEKVDLLFSGDLGGNSGDYNFEWMAIPASDWENAINGVPEQQKRNYLPGGPNAAAWEPASLEGHALAPRSFPIRVPQRYVMASHYFTVRYTPNKSLHPLFGAYSQWTDPKKLDGWLIRALGKTSPFNQKISVLDNLNGIGGNFMTTMLQKAGGPARDVALTPQGAADAGLIAIYQTLLDRGSSFSLDISINNDDINSDLLVAAGKLSDLYMLLGNEAAADAADPTIPVGDTFGLLGPGNIHAFMGYENINSLLDEELALLRGRHDINSAIGVSLSPVYNRIAWNLDVGTGINPEAAAVYYNNYNLEGDPVQSAKSLYPMGHGDAWGHYLSAIRNYYKLLGNVNFEWIPRAKVISVSGGNIQIDRFEERRFAECAVDRARSGLEIFNLTYRKHFLNASYADLGFYPDQDDAWQGFKDRFVYANQSRRAWGVDDWACRVGQGALLDWVMGNALLPTLDTDPGHTGVTRLDRTSVTELNELARVLGDVQDRMEKVDRGLNPLGIPDNAIPFDINASEFINNNVTHFDQILQRATTDVVNAYRVFRGAQGISEAMRQQYDQTQVVLNERVRQQQIDYRNRLIENFGYPYPQDTAYPQNYDGPDILHYMYVEPATVLNIDEGLAKTETILLRFTDFPLSNFDFNPAKPPEFNPSSVTIDVPFVRSTQGYGFVKPTGWTTRRAPGQIQQAAAEVMQARARIERAILEYDNLIAEIEGQIELLEARTGVRAENYKIQYGVYTKSRSLDDEITRSRRQQMTFRTIGRLAQALHNAIAEALPQDLIVGIASGGDLTSIGRSAIRLTGVLMDEVMTQLADDESITELGLQQAKDEIQSLSNLKITANNNALDAFAEIKNLEQMMRREATARIDIYTLFDALQQEAGRYRSTLAGGERLLQEWIEFRQRAAGTAAQARYRDMAFRVFRDEKLEKYRAHFDRAAASVYQAALAYDYEVNWQAFDPSGREDFLGRIVRARAIGNAEDGTPQGVGVAGTDADAGLAGLLSELEQSWQFSRVLLGIDNPEVGEKNISLRSELFRISQDIRSGGDAAWRKKLESFVVDDLGEIPDFVRYAAYDWTAESRPELGGALVRRPEPGLVIPFSTVIHKDMNTFGWPFSSGLDTRFVHTSFANRITTVGVWLRGLSSLNPTANVEAWLIPVGQDVLRNPMYNPLDPNSPRFNEWKIFEQLIPDPILLSANANDFLTVSLPESWIPAMHASSTTALSFGDASQNLFGGGQYPFSMRRYGAFLANHDNVPQEHTSKSTRLVGRSVWNTGWLLVIPGGSLEAFPNQAAGVQKILDEVTDIEVLLDYKQYSMY